MLEITLLSTQSDPWRRWISSEFCFWRVPPEPVHCWRAAGQPIPAPVAGEPHLRWDVSLQEFQLFPHFLMDPIPSLAQALPCSRGSTPDSSRKELVPAGMLGSGDRGSLSLPLVSVWPPDMMALRDLMSPAALNAMKRVGSPSHSSRVGFPPGRVAMRRRKVAGGHGVPGSEVVPRSLGSCSRKDLAWAPEEGKGDPSGSAGPGFAFLLSGAAILAAFSRPHPLHHY